MRSLLACCLAVVSFARDDSGPQALVRGHVVVTKHLSSSDGFYVEGREMTVTFNATNVGKEPAFNITVSDNFPEKDFRVVSGSFAPSLSVEELAPGTSAVSTLTLVPKSSGTMSTARAHVTYAYRLPPDYEEEPRMDEDGVPLPLQDVSVPVMSFSTSQGKVDILQPDVYARKSKKSEVGLLAVTVAALALVFVPLWLASEKAEKAHAE